MELERRSCATYFAGLDRKRSRSLLLMESIDAHGRMEFELSKELGSSCLDNVRKGSNVIRRVVVGRMGRL